MLSPFRMVCGNFILPEPASYVLFYAFFNLRKLLYIIQASSVIYSLIETAKENSLDPYSYLLWVLQTAPQLSETDDAWAEKLLPANAPEECHMPHK